MKNLVLSIVLITLFTSCLETEELKSGEITNLIFQSEYVNYAWGYNHNGWMMDRSGIVKRFQKTAAWVFPDSTGFISEADMQKNIAACDSVIAEVGTSEFKLYADKALTCVNGTMTKPENKMADAGEHIWAFYIYDSGKNGYKRIILDMTGDWSQENLAPNSKGIVDWMKKIE
jgi:hypothetical protein